MSPEQARGDDIETPSDIYSLAAVLTYAATGTAPHGHATNPLAMLMRVIDREPDLSGVPDDLREVLEPCVAKDPAHRPTAAELAARLAAVAPPDLDRTRLAPDAATLVARPAAWSGSAPTYPAALPPPVRLGRSHRLAVVVGAGAAVALALVITLVVVLLRPDPAVSALAAPTVPSPPAPPPARQVGTLQVGTMPDDVVVSPDGRQAYAINNGDLSVIDTATGTVTATVGMPSQPTGAAFSPDGGRMYVALLSGFVAVLDRASHASIAMIPVGQIPEAIAVTPDGRAAYVVDGLEGDSVSVIDTAGNIVVARVPVGPGTFVLAAAPDSRTVWSINRATGTLSLIDTSTHTLSATLPGPRTNDALVFAPDGSRAYLTGGQRLTTVSVFDAPGRSKLGEIRDISGLPADLAVSPSGRHLFVAMTKGIDGTSDTVRVIDTTTSFVVQDIPLDAPPTGLGLTPDGRTLYVASFNRNSVLVVDTRHYA